MKYLINDNNEYIGIDYLGDQPNGIEADPPKILKDHEIATWNGSSWSYNFQDINIPNIILKPKGTEALDILGRLQWYIAPGGGQRIVPKENKITILIPCYGKAQYIEETVSSCIKQTLKPYQVYILLMDEESIALKDKLESIDSCIYTEVHEQLNAAAARNYLVNKCSTEYFVFIDADDTMNETFLQVLYEKDASIVFGEVKREIPDISKKGQGSLYTWCSAGQNMTFLQCKTVWNELGGLDEDLAQGGEDTDYILRLLRSDWLIRKTFDTYYFYNADRGDLTKKQEFYESQFRNIKKNLAIFREELNKQVVRPDWFYNFMFNDKNFVDHDTLKYNYFIESIDYNIRDVYRFVNILNLYQSSRNIETKNTIETQYGLRTVDCIIYNLSQSNMDSELEIDLADNVQIKGNSNYNKLVYLLSNYCCYIEHLDYSIIKTQQENDFEILNHPTAFMLNQTCNRSCKYCNQLDKDSHLDDDTLYKNFDEMLTKVESISPLSVQILGGEPTLYSDDLIKRILNRLKNYSNIMIMTNHDKKDSYWEKDSRCYFYNHITEWHNYKIDPQAGDKYMIVLLHEDVPYLEDFLELNIDIVIHVIEYAGDIEDFKLTQEDRDYIKKLKQKYYWDNILINDVPLYDSEKDHIKCIHAINPWQANCIDKTFKVCCGDNQEHIDFYNFCGQLPDIKGCNNCNPSICIL